MAKATGFVSFFFFNDYLKTKQTQLLDTWETSTLKRVKEKLRLRVDKDPDHLGKR